MGRPNANSTNALENIAAHYKIAINSSALLLFPHILTSLTTRSTSIYPPYAWVTLTYVVASSHVRNLGAWFDERFSMETHITKTCSAAFYHLHNIRRIRKYLSQDIAETLIHAFVTSRIDYCNSLLFGFPSFQISKIQRVQNAAAHVIFMKSKYCHITLLLKELHWLPVTYRIQFRVILITFKALHDMAPSDISSLLRVRQSTKYSLRSNNAILHVNRTAEKIRGDNG